MGAIFGWFNPYRWMALAALVAALTAGYFGWAHHEQGIGIAKERAAWVESTRQLKAAAAAQLAVETAKTDKATAELTAARAALEDKDAKAEHTIAQLRADLRAKSRAAGGPGLRDPFAGRGGCRGGTQGAAAAGPVSGPADRSEASGLLSEPLERLLLRITSEADEVNRAYAACRADSFNVREVKP